MYRIGFDLQNIELLQVLGPDKMPIITEWDK